jgi:hypothetical protein
VPEDVVRVRINLAKRIVRQTLGEIADLVRELCFIAVVGVLGLEGITFELRCVDPHAISLLGALAAAGCSLSHCLFIGRERGSCARASRRAEKEPPSDARRLGIRLIALSLHRFIPP